MAVHVLCTSLLSIHTVKDCNGHQPPSHCMLPVCALCCARSVAAAVFFTAAPACPALVAPRVPPHLSTPRMRQRWLRWRCFWKHTRCIWTTLSTNCRYAGLVHPDNRIKETASQKQSTVIIRVVRLLAICWQLEKSLSNHAV